MTTEPARSWRCGVCGYVHAGDNPPEFCPICGAEAAEFDPYERPEPAPARSEAPVSWRCLVCNYIEKGSRPPETCPICGSPADQFEALYLAQPSSSSRKGRAGRVVIVGSGIAGAAAAEAAREASPDGTVLLLSQENRLPYYRLNLTRYLAGEIPATSLPLHEEDWYGQNRIEVRVGSKAVDLLPGENLVRTEDGQSIPFDALVLATGSHPFLPPVPGMNLEGVTTFRTSEDAERIADRVRGGVPCVCLGGGLLGLETAGALATQGAPVTVVEGHPWLMPHQLNQKAAELLERYLAGLGITVVTGARVGRLEGNKGVKSVLLDDGSRLPAGLVVVAAGTRPNTALARKAGLEVDRGIVVDQYMASSRPGIFAAGDAAEHNGIFYGNWAASQIQGQVAGVNSVGLEAEFSGLPRSNTMKVLDFDLVSLGEVVPRDGSYLGFEVEKERKYQQFLFRDGTLVGAILAGDGRLGPTLKQAMEKRLNFTDLLTRNPAGEDVAEFFAARIE